MSTPDGFTFASASSSEAGPSTLVLLPNPFPNTVNPGETLRVVLARINAFRGPERQIIGARSMETGHPLPLDMPIQGRVVAYEERVGMYLHMGPSSYRSAGTT